MLITISSGKCRSAWKIPPTRKWPLMGRGDILGKKEVTILSLNCLKVLAAIAYDFHIFVHLSILRIFFSWLCTTFHYLFCQGLLK